MTTTHHDFLDRGRVLYKNRHQETLVIRGVNPSSMISFEGCDNCSISLESKVARIIIQDCQNLNVSIKQNLLVGMDLNDSTTIKVCDKPDVYQFSIDVYKCSFVNFDTFGKYSVAVENSRNVCMNGTELAIDDYVLWGC